MTELASPCEGDRVAGAVVLQSPGDFLFFKDARLAEGYMEPIDVENGEYRAFTRDGRALCIEVVADESAAFFGLLKWRSERVELRQGPSAPFPVDELRDFLTRVGAPVGEDAGLEDLMSVGFDRYPAR